MKNASGKRPPDEAHGPGKEAIRPLSIKNFRQISPNVFAFSQFCFQNFTEFSKKLPKIHEFDENSLEFQQFLWKDQNMFDSQIS